MGAVSGHNLFLSALNNEAGEDCGRREKIKKEANIKGIKGTVVPADCTQQEVHSQASGCTTTGGLPMVFAETPYA